MRFSQIFLLQFVCLAFKAAQPTFSHLIGKEDQVIAILREAAQLFDIQKCGQATSLSDIFALFRNDGKKADTKEYECSTGKMTRFKYSFAGNYLSIGKNEEEYTLSIKNFDFGPGDFFWVDIYGQRGSILKEMDFPQNYLNFLALAFNMPQALGWSVVTAPPPKTGSSMFPGLYFAAYEIKGQPMRIFVGPNLPQNRMYISFTTEETWNHYHKLGDLDYFHFEFLSLLPDDFRRLKTVEGSYQLAINKASTAVALTFQKEKKDKPSETITFLVKNTDQCKVTFDFGSPETTPAWAPDMMKKFVRNFDPYETSAGIKWMCPVDCKTVEGLHKCSLLIMV